METPDRTTQPPIGDYAIIGDGRTAALVSRHGSVDWLCLPRFDGPSVFGALLDLEKGGRFHVRPTGAFRASRRYLPDTNILETTFETDGGVVRLLDLMTVPGEPAPNRLLPDHELLRRVECVRGSVDMEVLCEPRFDYGRVRPRTRELGRLGTQFDHRADAVLLRSDLPLEIDSEESRAHLRTTLDTGDRHYIALTGERAAPPLVPVLGAEAEQRIETTRRWWRQWISACAYRGEYEALVRRSLLALKLLIYPPSGAILASATTSLPEWIGGQRNWDYRYCWLRDASMTLRVLLELGFPREGEAFLGWLLHATRLTRPDLQVLYDVHGRTHHPERELELAGYRGSRPVRVGNDAADQLQLDNYGEVIAAAWEFFELGGVLDDAEAGLLIDLAGAIEEKWSRPDRGIWEVRSGPFHFTHSKVMCWVGLDRVLDLDEEGALSIEPDRRETLEAVRDEIAEMVERDGYSEGLGSYVATLGGTAMDASLLLLGISGYADASSERIQGTLATVRAQLDENGLLCRYNYDDGAHGREGAFGICGFWEAELLAVSGRVDEAHQRFRAMAGYANDVGLFSEEIDPRNGDLLGNFPQAFTHVGLLSAAAAIARAEGDEISERAAEPETTEATG